MCIFINHDTKCELSDTVPTRGGDREDFLSHWFYKAETPGGAGTECWGMIGYQLHPIPLIHRGGLNWLRPPSTKPGLCPNPSSAQCVQTAHSPYLVPGLPVSPKPTHFLQRRFVSPAAHECLGPSKSFQLMSEALLFIPPPLMLLLGQDRALCGLYNIGKKHEANGGLKIGVPPP